MASKPGLASGEVSAATVPGEPTAATVCGGRPRHAPTWSRTAAISSRGMFLGGISRRVASASVNGACAITAAIRGSSAATASTWPPLNDEPHTTIRFGSTPSRWRAHAITVW